MVRVRLEKITKRFKGILKEVRAVDNIDLEIGDKEFFTFLGPSGCGKTTTLRMIAGLETATSGSIYFDHEVINEVPTQKRNVAMVFQTPTLFPFMTVLDNMTYGLKVKSVPTNERKKRAEAAAKLLHLEDMLGRMPGELSGGEKQRVELGRAIIAEPRLFLLDEPLANLDARLREEVRCEVRRVHDKLGVTSIFVTHDQMEAMTISDKIAVFNKGKVIQVGPPKDLFHEPTNLFVASFVGSPPMVFFDSNLSQDCLSIGNEYFSMRIPEKTSIQLHDISASCEFVIGIRPEWFDIGESSRDCLLTGKVEMVEYLGNTTIAHIDVQDKEVRIPLSTQSLCKTGDIVGLKLSNEWVHLFDRHSGKKLINIPQ